MKPVTWFWLALQVGLTLVCLLPASRLPFDNSIDQFAVKGQAAQKRFETFQRHFERDQSVLITAIYDENGSENVAQRIRQTEPLFQQLGQLNGIAAHYTLETSIPQDYHQDFLPQAEATPMFPFVDRSGRSISAILMLEQQLEDQRRVALQVLLDKVAALNQAHPEFQLLATGEPVLNFQLNRSSEEVKYRIFPLLLLLCFLLLGLLFRSFKIALVTVLAVSSALAWTMGAMALAGERMNLVTNLIPALVFVLTVAMQMHLLLAIHHMGSVMAGLRAKLRANLMTTLTTSVGFASLMTSHVGPIAVMGLYMATGIWMAFASVHLTQLGLGRLLNLKVRRAPQITLKLGKSTYYSAWLKKVWPLLFPAAILFTGFAAIWHNPTESNSLNYFPAEHGIRRDTRMVEAHVTGTSNLEILVPAVYDEFDELDPNFFEAVQRFEKDLLDLAQVRHLISLGRLAQLPFMGEAPSGELEHPIDPQFALAYVDDDYYRIQLLVNTMGGPQYQQLQTAIQRAAEAALLHEPMILTGVLDRVLEIQDYLLQSLSKSMGITLGIVLLLMVFVVPFWDGFKVVLMPNLFPLAVMAVLAWVLDYPTSISVVMVFSIAFGIAVDDSIHLLDSYFKKAQGDFETRWKRTLICDLGAISMTTLVLTFGFLTLTASSFQPTVQFGILLSAGMVSALLGDIFFLPLLLRLYRKE